MRYTFPTSYVVIHGWSVSTTSEKKDAFLIGPAFWMIEAAVMHGGRATRTRASRDRGQHLALRAAIEGGFRWTKNDADAMARLGVPCGEREHTLALAHGNLSAATSILAYLHRKAWIWPGETWFEGRLLSEGRKAAPIGEGMRVYHQNGWWEVTSIVSDEKLTICRYSWLELASSQRHFGAPTARRTFTRDELKKLVEDNP